LLDFLQVIITVNLLSFLTAKPPGTWHILAECQAGAYWSCRKKKPVFYIVDLVNLINAYIEPKYME
jgi:hypothetical protein